MSAEPFYIKVCFFARLRQEVGVSETVIEVSAPMSVAEVWKVVLGKRALPANVLTACNQEYCALDHLVSAGDEIAFFPPVTGG